MQLLKSCATSHVTLAILSHNEVARQNCRCALGLWCKVKGKVLKYSLPSIEPGADPGVQAVSPQVTWSHPPGGELQLLSARPAVTYPAEERHRPSAGTKLYCLVTETHACEQLAQGCYLEADRPRFKTATFRIVSECSTVKPHKPQSLVYNYIYSALSTGITGITGAHTHKHTPVVTRVIMTCQMERSGLRHHIMQWRRGTLTQQCLTASQVPSTSGQVQRGPT